MKKTFVIILALFLLVLSQQKSNASDVDISPVPSITQIPQEVQYELAYPGLLPDNPLYFLKALRDNILAFLIVDPAKKADYDLLMADKRLVSSQMLMNQGKNDLAITTLSKSGNYFYQAIQKVAEAKRQGDDTQRLTNKLQTASKKHEQVISEMVQETKGQTRVSLEALLQRAKDFEQSVEQLKPK